MITRNKAAGAYLPMLVLLVAALVLAFAGCSQKTYDFKGVYRLETTTYQGVALSAKSPGDLWYGSTITATKVGGTSWISISMIGDVGGSLDATISEYSKSGERITYKCWVQSNYGSMFVMDKGDFFYLYFDESDNTVTLKIGSDMSMLFRGN